MPKYIQLTKGMQTLVDDDDYEWLSQWKWHASRGPKLYYAVREDSKKHVNIRMHREITQPTGNLIVDHINGDSLDNRRENLRVCSRRANTVYYHHRELRVTRIHTLAGKFHVYLSLGIYNTREEANAVADQAEKDYAHLKVQYNE